MRANRECQGLDDIGSNPEVHDSRRFLSIFLQPNNTHPHNVNKYVPDSCADATKLTKVSEPPTAANMGADLKDTTAAPAKPKRMSSHQLRM
jgi:hypothetical protein